MTMALTETVILSLQSVRCCSCGVVFGIESGHMTRLRESHESFYCPNGHVQGYYGKTDKELRIEALERESKALKSSRDFWAEQSKSANREVGRKSRQVNGYKGVVTRMKRRAVAGRCPCCSHQFQDLERHMKNQHPKFDPDRAAEALAGKP